MKSFTLSLILLAVPFSYAAEDKLEVRFLAERIPADLGQVVLAAEEAHSEPFDLPMNNISAPQSPPGRLFSVWSEDHGKSLATIKLPEEGDSFIVLMITLPEKVGYNPVVMPYRNPKFNPGDIYFYNLADKPVLGYVGTTKFIINAGNSQIVTPKGAREARFYDVGLGVREEDGDKLLATTRWPETENIRYYVFFFIDPKTKLITFRGVDEYVAPEISTP